MAKVIKTTSEISPRDRESILAFEDYLLHFHYLLSIHDDNGAILPTLRLKLESVWSAIKDKISLLIYEEPRREKLLEIVRDLDSQFKFVADKIQSKIDEDDASLELREAILGMPKSLTKNIYTLKQKRGAKLITDDEYLSQIHILAQSFLDTHGHKYSGTVTKDEKVNLIYNRSWTKQQGKSFEANFLKKTIFSRRCLAVFCSLYSESGLEKRTHDESAELFCEKICERFKLDYSIKVAKVFYSCDRKEFRDELINNLLPTIDKTTSDAILKYINTNPL